MPETPSPPSPIDEQTLISRNDTLLVAPVHDETVMMDIKSGHYYGLDDIGSEVWKHLETPRRLGELIDVLVAEYDADRAVIANDMQKLVNLMATHNVVTLT